MNKVVFFHDHVFIKYIDGHYSEGKLTDSTWSRYTDLCQELLVVCRYKEVYEINEVENLNLTCDEKVKFDCIKPWSNRALFFSKSIKRKIADIIDDNDVVICRLPSVLGFIAFDIAKRKQKRIVCEAVGCPWDSYFNHGSLSAKILAPVMFFRMKYALKMADFSIYVTKDFLQGRYPTTGKYCSASNVVIKAHKIRAKHKNTVKKIMFIGSLNTKYKGLTDLILALSYINDDNIELNVLGGGDKKYYIELIDKLGIEDRVVFSPPLPGGDSVLEWLSKGDIYVHPSHTEGLPRSLIEAMSVGLPCIGTTVGGIPELLQESCLVPPRKPELLSNKLLEFIQSPSLRMELSKVNLSRSKEYESDVLSKRRHDFLKTSLF